MLLLSSLIILITASVADGAVAPSTSAHSVTVVSGYWTVKSKHLVSSYTTWFQNTLKVRCPYVFFHDSSEVVQMVSDIRIRGNRNLYPTHFIQRNLTTVALKFNYSEQWTHYKHVKTAELAVVWLDKVNMMADVAALNPYQSEWFAWIDAGIALYRNLKIPSAPWPNPFILPTLPKDRIIYSDSGSHPAHSFAGTAFMYHQDLVTSVQTRFMAEYMACVERYQTQKSSMLWVCGIDQGHFTRMKEKEPGLFVNTGVGYGTMVQKLFLPRLDPAVPSLYTKELLLSLHPPSPSDGAGGVKGLTNYPHFPKGSRRKQPAGGKQSKNGGGGGRGKGGVGNYREG